MLATFTRPMRGHPTRLILDGFGADFFILFDTEEDPESPATMGTVNIAVCELFADDFLADSICLVMNANKFGVMRFLSAIGVHRFDDKTKAWFYSLGSVLRTDNPSPPSPEREMSEEKKPNPPMVHANGTGREQLLDVREKAYYALLEAYDAIKQIAPNGRDYYPYGPGALEQAQDHNMRRLSAIQSVIDDISEEMVAVVDQ